eukprot:SM000061S19293  [mRNA]  locus=s61:534570:535534:- [translate_table: standard]
MGSQEIMQSRGGVEVEREPEAAEVVEGLRLGVQDLDEHLEGLDERRAGAREEPRSVHDRDSGRRLEAREVPCGDDAPRLGEGRLEVEAAEREDEEGRRGSVEACGGQRRPRRRSGGGKGAVDAINAGERQELGRPGAGEERRIRPLHQEHLGRHRAATGEAGSDGHARLQARHLGAAHFIAVREERGRDGAHVGPNAGKVGGVHVHEPRRVAQEAGQRRLHLAPRHGAAPELELREDDRRPQLAQGLRQCAVRREAPLHEQRAVAEEGGLATGRRRRCRRWPSAGPSGACCWKTARRQSTEVTDETTAH